MDYILSVVLPTYNTEQYLGRCIDSLLDERINGKVEIIVINDGSKDDSLAIAQSYADRYSFVVVIDKINGGHGSTINKGIEIATGKYFRVLDSDDWFETSQFVAYVEKLYTIDIDVVVTWGYFNYTYENKQLPYVMFSDDKIIEYDKKYTFETFDFKDQYILMAHLTYLTSVVKRSSQKLQENTFYVDNEFLVYPMANVVTFVFFDLYIYHYFIGRPTQSMNVKILKKNISHFKRVGTSLVSFMNRTEMDAEKKKYLYNITYRVIRSYYVYLLSYFHFNRWWAYHLLMDWNNFLKEYDISLYKKLDNDPYIYTYRKFPFLFSFLSPFLYSLYFKIKGSIKI